MELVKQTQQPDCVNIPHKQGECWWCDITNLVLDKVAENLKVKKPS